MRYLFTTVLLLLPIVSQAQGLLETMQADIVKAQAEVSTLKADLKIAQADLLARQADVAALRAESVASSTALNAAKAALATAQADLATLTTRLAALEKIVIPPPPPPSPPPTPTPTDLNLLAVGGWRLEGDYFRGGLAIDHANKKAYVIGHAQRNEVVEFDLPAHGTGTDIALWPRVKATKVHPLWWAGGHGYGNGVAFWKGKVWVSPRVYYDTANPPVAVTTWFAQDGEKIVIPLPRQMYSGFVKSATGIEPGCGGYESGQGSSYGPTLATMDGAKLIAGKSGTTWDNREKREPNYFPFDHIDKWYAYEPRAGEGRWGIDRIYGGGLRTSSGIYYWPYMGTGDLNYARQTTTFSANNAMNKTYLYRYDPVTYQLLGWKETAFTGPIQGQDISPDGKQVYLLEGQQWKIGVAAESPALRLYDLK